MRQDELAERLEAFADATLDPDPDAMSQIRAVVVARAERKTPREPARRGLFVVLGGFSAPRFNMARRVGYVAGAAVLVLTMATGAMAASGPGGPLYDTRLWFETMGLPSSGSARANSELPLLDQRLKEARDAAARGDVSALQAALNAYGKTLDDASQNAGPDDRSKLDSVLSKHVGVLEGLLGDTGGKSQQAIQAAIDRAIEKIDGLNGGSGPGGSGGSGGSGGGGSGGSGGGADRTPHPHPTPHASPRSGH